MLRMPGEDLVKRVLAEGKVAWLTVEMQCPHSRWFS